ncbi:MAG TPA: SsgA family sporulation/cell division regulator [Mycobacteriales bacterium]|nr:SsgA family sporulation/cell division regulator [Mycobacteriales bacterium]
MSPRPTTVSADLQLRLVVPGSSALPVRASMRYDVADPYAVSVAFHTGPADGSGDVVEWTFARQLLTDGVTGPVGEGDVQVWPSSSAGAPVVCLALSSPSGKALFEIPLPALVDFLGSTYAAVPTGGESAHVDVDAELALLLWAEPET